MILDNEQQRALLLELLQQANFPGKAIDVVYDLKKALQNASILEDRNDNKQ